MLTVAPALGTFVQIGNNIVHAEAFKAGSTGTRALKFNVKADEKINTKTEVVGEPVDLIMIIDGSDSQDVKFDSGDNPEKRTIDVALGDALKLAESLPEGSQVMIAFYDTNKIDSYAKKGVTKLISKAEAVKTLNEFKDFRSYKKFIYPNWEEYLNKAGDKIFDKSSTDHRPFEETYEKDPAKKNKYVSVIQFTDDWMDDEDIDISFANWSKSKAKTFMSVLYPSYDYENMRSETMMKKVGHPNIYNARGKTDATRQKDIIDKFKSTAIQTTTTKTRISPEGSVTVSAEKDVNLSEVELVSPKGTKTKLEVKDGKAVWTGKFDEDGEYKVNYKFTGTPSEIRKVTGDVKVSNKQVVNATDTIEPNKSSDVDTAKEDIPFKTIEEKDPTLPFGERKVKVKGVLGERTITKTFEVINGKRVGNPKVDTKVTKEPVDEIVVVGTKVEEKVNYKTIHKGDDGKTLKEENVAAEKSEFEGYKYIKTEANNSDKLNVLTNHIYHKLITTYKGIDANGKEVILEKVDGTKDKKDFKDYVFEKTEKLDNGDVVHHYHYKVNYKTINKGDDGKVLKEENKAAEKSEFEGYKYVKTETDNSDKLNVLTTHIYHKLITTYKGIDANGKEVILEKVDGTKDKKDFNDYVFEKTEKLDNGDVVHLYKAKKADEKKKPVETGANASSAIMPLIGISSGLGIMGAAAYVVKRKRK